ncbi:hypothetical protein [Butyrivibrio sp. FC2001]|uniref:hypothetical protein n=1 Tax=Butyrivibrio sp. FC2001 TaxID=1280671 RepID=UPI0003FBE5FA|nr:hypothetical protein [Butyrivibrio sp. FC2001]
MKKIMPEEKRIILFIIGAFVVSRMIIYWVCHSLTGEIAPAQIIKSLSVFDSEWYGYYVDLFYTNEFVGMRPNGMAPWAFFPLYPLLVNICHRLMGGMVAVNTVGAILSSILFMLAEFWAYKYIMYTRNDKKVAYTFIIFMSFGAYSFYFSILYTESLFLLLLVLCFYHMVKGNYLRMGLFGALLSATRNAGVFFVFVILVYQIMKYLESHKDKFYRLFIGFLKYVFAQERLVLGTFMVPSGLFAYMLYLHFKLGDGFAFVHVQYAWGRENVGVFKNLYDAVVKQFPADYLGLVLLFFLAVLIYSFFVSKNYYELVYPLIIIYLGASSRLLSIPRFMVGAFIPVLCFSEHFSKLNKCARIIILCMVCVFEMILVREWIHWNGYLC